MIERADDFFCFYTIHSLNIIASANLQIFNAVGIKGNTTLITFVA